MNPEIFISYSQGGEGEVVAHKIYASLKEKSYQVILDKIDLGYKGNVKEFIERIGDGKAIIPIIGDDYLKSENCMSQIMSIHKNKNIWLRIFPIVLDDAKIYDEIDRIDYLNFWDLKIENLKNKIKTMTNPVGTEKVIGSINQYSDIRRIIDEILDMLRNMNTLAPEIHAGNNFSFIIESLDKYFLSQPVNSDSIRSSSDNENLEKLYTLIDQYEQKLMLSNDPKEKMLCNDNIKDLKKQITEIEKRLSK